MIVIYSNLRKINYTTVLNPGHIFVAGTHEQGPVGKWQGIVKYHRDIARHAKEAYY